MPVLWNGAVTAFLALLRKTMRPGDEIVMLPVQATYPGGRVKVKGSIVPVSGTAQVSPGQSVPVLVRTGTPILAFAHSARRAQPAGIIPVPRRGILEHLFIAGADGSREVWFRNDSVCAPLGLRAQLGHDPVGLKWCQEDPRAFLVWHASVTGTASQPIVTTLVWVVSLNRPGIDAPFPERAVPSATVEQLYDLEALNDIVLVNVTYDQRSVETLRFPVLRPIADEEGLTHLRGPYELHRLEEGTQVVAQSGTAQTLAAGAIRDLWLTSDRAAEPTRDLLVLSLAGMRGKTITLTGGENHRQILEPTAGPGDGPVSAFEDGPLVLRTQELSPDAPVMIGGIVMPFVINVTRRTVLVRGLAPSYNLGGDSSGASNARVSAPGGFAGFSGVWVEGWGTGESIVTGLAGQETMLGDAGAFAVGQVVTVAAGTEREEAVAIVETSPAPSPFEGTHHLYWLYTPWQFTHADDTNDVGVVTSYKCWFLQRASFENTNPVQQVFTAGTNVNQTTVPELATAGPVAQDLEHAPFLRQPLFNLLNGNWPEPPSGGETVLLARLARGGTNPHVVDITYTAASDGTYWNNASAWWIEDLVFLHWDANPDKVRIALSLGWGIGFNDPPPGFEGFPGRADSIVQILVVNGRLEVVHELTPWLHWGQVPSALSRLGPQTAIAANAFHTMWYVLHRGAAGPPGLDRSSMWLADYRTGQSLALADDLSADDVLLWRGRREFVVPSVIVGDRALDLFARLQAGTEKFLTAWDEDGTPGDVEDELPAGLSDRAGLLADLSDPVTGEAVTPIPTIAIEEPVYPALPTHPYWPIHSQEVHALPEPLIHRLGRQVTL